jgi:hypothetical protein
MVLGPWKASSVSKSIDSSMNLHYEFCEENIKRFPLNFLRRWTGPLEIA